MKEIESIVVERAIIHVVDTKKKQLTLSDWELSVDGNQELQKYLSDHMLKSVQDSASRTAIFKEESRFKNFLKELGQKKFIGTSKSIASHLFESSDRRISAGAVAICLFRSPSLKTTRSFLGILKLDQSNSFHPVKQERDDGTIAINFEKVEGTVPSSGERLLKCAFLKPHDTDTWEHDLVVLDRQTATTDEPAKFFTSDFLGAEFFGSPADMTRTFYSSSNEILEDNRYSLGNTKTEQLRGAVKAALVSGKSIDVKQWVDNLNVKEPIKKSLREKLTASIADASFDVDEATVSKLTKTRTLRGAHGFKMSVESEFYNSIVKDRTEEGNVTVLTLRIPDLKES